MVMFTVCVLYIYEPKHTHKISSFVCSSSINHHPPKTITTHTPSPHRHHPSIHPKVSSSNPTINKTQNVIGRRTHSNRHSGINKHTTTTRERSIECCNISITSRTGESETWEGEGGKIFISKRRRRVVLRGFYIDLEFNVCESCVETGT